MLKVILGVLSFAVIVFFASQSFASANDDFTTGTIITHDSISYSIPYIPFPSDSLSYNPHIDVCEYWSVSPLGDWYYGYIENPLVTYELTFWSSGTRVVECSTRE